MKVYVSSDMGGLFRSLDGGATWRDVDFRQLQGGTLSQVQFTSDPRKMGEFANATWLKVAAWSAAVVIAALNLWLLVQTFQGWLA